MIEFVFTYLHVKYETKIPPVVAQTVGLWWQWVREMQVVLHIISLCVCASQSFLHCTQLGRGWLCGQPGEVWCSGAAVYPGANPFLILTITRTPTWKVHSESSWQDFGASYTTRWHAYRLCHNRRISGDWERVPPVAAQDDCQQTTGWVGWSSEEKGRMRVSLSRDRVHGELDSKDVLYPVLVHSSCKDRTQQDICTAL